MNSLSKGLLPKRKENSLDLVAPLPRTHAHTYTHMHTRTRTHSFSLAYFPKPDLYFAFGFLRVGRSLNFPSNKNF